MFPRKEALARQFSGSLSQAVNSQTNKKPLETKLHCHHDYGNWKDYI